MNKFFLQILLNALKKFNLNCVLHLPNSIFIDGKKISGNAQIFKKNSVLHNGTLLVKTNLKLLNEVLKTNIAIKDQRYIPSIKTNTTNLHNFNKKITIEKIIQNIVENVEKIFQVKLNSINLTEKELNQAKLIKEKRYLNENWEYRIR